jgi:hypothetical protein
MPREPASEVSLLLASALILMNTFAQRSLRGEPSARLAIMIEAHLTQIAEHDDMPDVLRQTAEQMSDRWAQLCRPAAKAGPGASWLAALWPLVRS